jgi:tetratricopeptide (TPR) repeat protein
MRRSPLLVLLALALTPAAAPAAADAAPPEATDGTLAADFLEARLLAEEGFVEDALSRLDRVAAGAPGDPYLRLARAELLFRAGRLDEASSEVAAAALAAPGNPDVLRLQGRIELARADREPRALEIATAAFERLRQDDPEDLEALLSLGQLYLATGRAGLAADALAEAARLRPGHPGIESLLARALDSTPDPDQAERIQRGRVAREPEALAQRLELADLLARRGAHAEAVAVLEAAPAAQAALLDVRRRLALELFLDGELERARTLAAAIVEEWPGYGGGRLLLARIQVAHGLFVEAESILSPLLGPGARPPAVDQLHTRILEETGRIDEAAAELLARADRFTAEERTVEAAATRLELARLLARHERWSEALEAARQAAEGAEPEVAEVATRLAASALGELRRFDEALELLGEADPNRPERAARRVGLLLDAGRGSAARREAKRLLDAAAGADVELGAIYAERQRWGDALPLFERAAARDRESLDVEFRLAVALERSGRVEESIVRFRNVVERAPEFAPALNYLGYLWIEREESLEAALDLVVRAVKLDPDNGAYVDSLGWGYHRLGRSSEAVEALERAARLMPGDPTVLGHLGEALLGAGERERAIEAFRRAARLEGPEAEAAARRLAALEVEP